MSKKEKLKHPLINRAKSVFRRDIEFYTKISIEDCWDRLLTKEYWKSKDNILFAKPKIKLDYAAWKSENIIEFKIDNILTTSRNQDRISISGQIHHLHNGVVLVAARTYVNPFVLIPLIVLFFTHFLLMGYCAISSLFLPFLLFPIAYLLIAGLLLHSYASSQSMLIDLIYDVLSTERKLPLSTGV